MSSTSSQHREGLVAIADGKAMTTSEQVAHFFGKPHSKILLGIDLIQMELPLRWYGPHFLQIGPALGSGGKRDARMRTYRMTCEGFMLLSIGFVGKSRRPSMLAYLEQFGLIEKAILNRQYPRRNAKRNGSPRSD